MLLTSVARTCGAGHRRGTPARADHRPDRGRRAAPARSLRASASRSGAAAPSSSSRPTRRCTARRRTETSDYAFYDDELDQAALNRFKRIAEMREAIADEAVHARLPAGRQSRPVRGRRARGTAALAAPDARRGAAARVHPARRGVGADRADRPLGAARGLLLRLTLRALLGRDLEIAVNVSARQLQHPEFLEHVEEALWTAQTCRRTS